MTSWVPERISPRGPVYIAIADALADDVRSGRLKVGDRLPTHRALAGRLGVNVVTVTRAYAEAARRGLVEGEVGRGTFVRFAPGESPMMLPALATPPQGINFHANTPIGGQATEAGEATLKRLAAQADELLNLGYEAPGLLPHRAAGAAWMARAGVETDAERTLVCTGAQHALAVALGSVTEPGDLLLVEELTYPGIKALAALYHLRTHPVALDAHGIVPASFEDACRRANAKALYCMPTLQNPTGTVMPEERRRELAELARKYGVTIVEDDTTGFLCEDVPPPLAALAPELTVFVTSLSKSVAPGLRIGYLSTPEGADALRERMIASLAALTWMTPPLTAAIATAWIEDGTADATVEHKRADARARRAIFDRVLDVETPTHPACSYVWMPLPPPWRAESFTAQAHRHGVVVAPPEPFVVGRAAAPHAVRLSLCTPPTQEETERGLTILGGLLAGVPEVRQALV